MSDRQKIYDGIDEGINKGKIFRHGTFDLNPASLNANTEVVESVTIEGARVGDVVIVVPPSGFAAGLICQGASVTSGNTVGVKLRNITASSVDGGEQTWGYQILHMD